MENQGASSRIWWVVIGMMVASIWHFDVHDRQIANLRDRLATLETDNRPAPHGAWPGALSSARFEQQKTGELAGATMRVPADSQPTYCRFCGEVDGYTSEADPSPLTIDVPMTRHTIVAVECSNGRTFVTCTNEAARALAGACHGEWIESAHHAEGE